MRICPVCKNALTKANACELRIRIGGYCRPCNAKRSKDYRGHLQGPRPCKQCKISFEPKLGNTKFCSEKCRSSFWKVNNPERAERKRLNEIKRIKQRLQKVETERQRYYKIVFYQKIFQPCICTDCGIEFETLRPIEWIALDIKGGCASKQRCKPCQRIFRLLNHGGGPKRRCKIYGVPYKAFNARTIFESNNWTCCLCGISTPEVLRGTYEDNAPELDHIWPLSVIRNGIKSPGHVKSNCWLLCRKCNGKKGVKDVPTPSNQSVPAFDSGSILGNHPHPGLAAIEGTL